MKLDSAGNTIWGMIDIKGTEILDFSYLQLYAFSEGWAACQQLDGTWNYVNEKQEFLLEESVDYAFPFENKAATIFRNGNASIIDISGKYLLEGYSDISRKYPDYWAIYMGGNALLINNSDVKKGWYYRPLNKVIWSPTN